MKKIFVLLLSFLLYSQAESQPSYKIWSVVTSQNISKGDTVIFDIGLSGNGFINPKYLKIALYSDTTSKIFIKNMIEPKELLVINFPGIISFLFNKDSLSYILPSDSLRITVNKHFSTVPKTSGDKTIKVIATYSSDGLTWNTEEAFINFHVNTWYEEYETWLVIFGLIFAFIAILDPISNVYRKLFKKKFSQIPESNKHSQRKQK